MQTSAENTAKELNNSLRNCIMAGALGVFFFMIVQNGPIPLLLEKAGAGGIAIGLTATLFQLGMLIQIPAAFFTERLSRRKLFWAGTTLAARAAIAIPGILLLVSPDQTGAVIWVTLGALGVFSFVAQASAPAWLSWMADLIPDDRRAGFWAKRQGICMIAAALSVALTGWFLDLFPESSMSGFGWILIFASMMGILDVVVHWKVTEPSPTPINRSLSVVTRIIRPLQEHDFRYFTLSMCVWFFGLGLFGPFLNVYLKSTFDVTYTHLSAIQLAGMISSIVASFVGGRLISHTGLRTYGLAMVIAIPLFSGAWFFLNGNTIGRIPQPVIVLSIVSLLAGGVYAAVGMLHINLLTVLAPTQGRTMAMAVHSSIVGLVAAAGPLVGGLIKDYITENPIDILLSGGIPCSYFHIILILHALLIWFVMLPLLFRIQKKDGEWPLNQAAIHIFIYTPLRSVRNAYNFNLAVSTAAVNIVKGTATAAGKMAARAARETGTTAIKAVKDNAAARQKRESKKD